MKMPFSTSQGWAGEATPVPPNPARSTDPEVTEAHFQKGGNPMIMGQNIWLVLIIVFIVLVVLGVITVAA